VKLFYSYSATDETLRRELEKHLSLLKADHLIDTWTFRNIDAGQDWEKEIDARLEEADLILLLVSADFLASKYCWDKEMKRAIERADSGEATVIPILLRSCDWQAAPFAKLQLLPENAKPVTLWRPRDRGWANVVAGVRKHVESASPVTTSAMTAAKSDIRSDAPNTIEKAKHVIAAVQRAKVRSERLRDINTAAASEGARTFIEVSNIVAGVNETTPDLKLSVGWNAERCVVRVGNVSLVLSVEYERRSYWDNPPVPAFHASLWFGAVPFPNERKRWRLRNKPEEFVDHYWVLELDGDDVWKWRVSNSDQRISSGAVAEDCIDRLLDFHVAVESGRRRRP
jgi:hypothetical protein